MTNKQPTYIFDFDSTLTKVEAFEALAEISLQDRSDKDAIIQQIKTITDQGVDGDIPFDESLNRRIQLLHATRQHLERLIEDLKEQLSESVKRNIRFFHDYAENIYIVSSGFKEFIEPVVEQLHIQPHKIHANTFVFDENDLIIGADTSNPLAGDDGKVACVKTLGLTGDVVMVGDGYSDYTVRKAGLATEFYAFTENVTRQNILDKADFVASSLDELLFNQGLPMATSYPKSKINIMLLEGIHSDAEARLKAEGFTVTTVKDGMNEEELSAVIKDVSVLGIRSKTQITEKVLENANKLWAIGAFCIGTNQIDLTACAKKGVAVFNAPYSNTRSVVELALGEIIMLMRRTFEHSTNIYQGKWNKSAANSYEVRGKKLGIVGYGNIGSQLSVLAEAMGMEVYYYDIVEKLALGNAKKCLSMQQLLSCVDVVSLHVDGRPSNDHMFGAEEINAMKPGSYLVNLSRGMIVDIDALKAGLDSGHILGAALDVFPEEPKVNKGEFVSPLCEHPNVILTPHVGGSTQEAQMNIADFVPGKLADYVNTGNTYDSVNFPNIQLPHQSDAHRLLHIHHNVPGILAKVNSVLAKFEMNILGQYLKTNEHIGYLITDVDQGYPKEVMQELGAIENTIRFRVLY